MGKTNDKVKLIVIDPRLWEIGQEKFQELINKGHDITFVDLSEVDGVIGEQASRMNEHLLPRIDVLIKEIRKRRRVK